MVNIEVRLGLSAAFDSVYLAHVDSPTVLPHDSSNLLQILVGAARS